MIAPVQFLHVGQAVRCTDLHREGILLNIEPDFHVALVRFDTDERWVRIAALKATGQGARHEDQ